jgi:hypothetical protein
MSSLHRHTLTLPGRLSGVAPAPLVSAVPEPPAPPKVDDGITWKSFQTGLDAALADVRTWRRDVGSELARVSVTLATAIAERLLETEIAVNRQRLDRIVQRSLEQMQAAQAIVVRGHPDDLSLLRRQLDAHSLIGHSDDLVLRADATLKRGQLKIETDEWFLEWDTQRCVSELHELLQEAIVADE